MKYYLLTFNQDWADEHDVPALNCFNETDYNKWLSLKLAEPNPNYEKELKEYKQRKQKEKDFSIECQKRRSKVVHSEDQKKFMEWYNLNYPRGSVIYPKKYYSYLTAYLGNSGSGFEDNFSDYGIGQDFITAGIVNVFEVSEDFYNTFKKANLDKLSLCNIFMF